MKSIWDWMKPYLVVEISSDIVTEYCCHVCVLAMMFCRCVAVCCKWLRNQQETPRRGVLRYPRGLKLWQANVGYKRYYLHLIFTYCVDRDTSVLELFHVVSQQKRFAVLTQAIENRLQNCWIAVERPKMTSISIHIIANQASYHDDKST